MRVGVTQSDTLSQSMAGGWRCGKIPLGFIPRGWG